MEDEARRMWASAQNISGAGWSGMAEATSLDTMTQMNQAFRNIVNMLHGVLHRRRRGSLAPLLPIALLCIVAGAGHWRRSSPSLCSASSPARVTGAAPPHRMVGPERSPTACSCRRVPTPFGAGWSAQNAHRPRVPAVGYPPRSAPDGRPRTLTDRVDGPRFANRALPHGWRVSNAPIAWTVRVSRIALSPTVGESATHPSPGRSAFRESRSSAFDCRVRPTTKFSPMELPKTTKSAFDCRVRPTTKFSPMELPKTTKSAFDCRVRPT